MNAHLRIVASSVAVLVAIAQAPALAQYANEFTPAKLIHQGKTTNAIAGSGTVVVQVQVNADGSHKAVKVIRSSNSGDNAAAHGHRTKLELSSGSSRIHAGRLLLRFHAEVQRQVGGDQCE